MVLENRHNQWYVIDGRPLTIEEFEEFEKNRVWRALYALMSDQVLADYANRDAVNISHGEERFLLGRMTANRTLLDSPKAMKNFVLQVIREEILNGRRHDGNSADAGNGA